MPNTLEEPITVEVYRGLPITGYRYQLIEDDLCMVPAPNRYHQGGSRNIEFMILKWIESAGGGRI